MIIFTAAFSTAETAAGRPLTHARIGWDTRTRDAVAADVTVSSESATGPKDAPLRPDTAEYWEPTSLPATWVLDFSGSPTFNIDYVGIAAHTCGTNGNTVTVETSLGFGSPTWESLATAVSPPDDKPLLFLDTSRDAVQMRVTISGGTVPRIAVIYVGQILAMQRPIYGGHTPLPLSRETELHSSLSRGGQFLGQNIRRMGVRGGATFRNLTAAWYRTNFDQFVAAARKYPYFFAWRPGTFNDELGYVWTLDDIAPTNMGTRDLMSVSWEMRGIGNG